MIVTRLTKQGGGIIFRASPESMTRLINSIVQVTDGHAEYLHGFGYLLDKLEQQAETAVGEAAKNGQQCFFVLPACEAMLTCVGIQFFKMVDVGAECKARKAAGEKDFVIDTEPELPFCQFIAAVHSPLEELGLRYPAKVILGCLANLVHWPAPPPACYLTMVAHAYMQEFRTRRPRATWLRDLPVALKYDGAATKAARKALGEGDPDSPWETGDPCPQEPKNVVW